MLKLSSKYLHVHICTVKQKKKQSDTQVDSHKQFGD